MTKASGRRTPVTSISPETIATSVLTIETPHRGFFDITADARQFLREAEAQSGALTLFVRHTSASLTIQENADPDVLKDLVTALDRLAPEDGGWNHGSEGPDDMPAHIKTMLTSCSLTIPVIDGAMALGTWQGLYLIEHRTRPHRREIVLQFLGSELKSASI
ncbi:MAG: secondary thiamine-phosphate synthase enzyme YjbQ [Xanthobacteraceae bacterium]|nr:secondary thiamine-phosphate synthase enzyme YjbQ [Xanthobacteraceae bacterium]